MTIQPIRWTLAAIAASGLLAMPTARTYADDAAVRVEGIDIRGEGDAREVVVRTSKAPTFSVFRLAEPFRVLIDVNNGQMDGANDLRKVGDGVIRYIATNRFADDASSILRIEVALEEVVAYSARADGNAIIVTVGSEKPLAQPQPLAEPTAGQPDGFGAGVSAASKIRLGEVRRRMRGEVAILRTDLSGPAPKMQLQQLDNPPRLVIDLEGAAVEPKWQRVRVDRLGITNARVADKAGSVRLVLDMTRDAEVPSVRLETKDGKLDIVISPAGTASAEAATEKARTAAAEEAVVPSAPAPAPAARPAPSDRPVVRVHDVRFEPKDGFVRLTLVLAGQSPLPRAEGDQSRTPVLRVDGARLPESLERTLDVVEVAPGVVDTISTYNEAGVATILANIRAGTEHRFWRKGNKLMWDFRNPSAPDTRRVAYGERGATGFSSASAASQIIAKSATGQTRRRYSGRRISLDLKDADIQNVLRLLADVSKLNIVAADDVQGKITIKLRNVPWDQALDIILRSKQLDKIRNGNIIRVAPIKTLQEEEELRVKRAKSRVQLEPLSVRLIPVSYAVASDVMPQVSALLSERGKVNIDKRTNVLVVEDIQEVLVKVERLVRTLDTQTPQVLIEARIVEARSNFSRELGIQWGGQVIASQATGNSTGLTFPNTVRVAGGADDIQNQVTSGVQPEPFYAVNLPATVGSGSGGALGFTLGSLGGTALVNIRLSAAESEGKVKIISAPKIVTLDNAQAKIVSGERIPITVITANGPTTRFIEANLELTVRPHVTQDGSILMGIQAAKNELSDRRDNLGVPGIITKEATTVMIVRDGDTAVLGGIYRRTATETDRFVPWLGKIPVLGWLFKNRTRSDARDELLIFISPRIVNRSAALVNTN